MVRRVFNTPLSKKQNKKKLLLALNIQKLHNIPNIEIVFVSTPGHISLFLGLKNTTNLELTIFSFQDDKTEKLAEVPSDALIQKKIHSGTYMLNS